MIEAATACAVWASGRAPALADAAATDPARAADSLDQLGLGGAHLFGFVAGLALFALRTAIRQRKAHLAEFKR